MRAGRGKAEACKCGSMGQFLKDFSTTIWSKDKGDLYIRMAITTLESSRTTKHMGGDVMSTITRKKSSKDNGLTINQHHLNQDDLRELVWVVLLRLLILSSFVASS